jgi:hypothetical protein
MDMPLDDRPPFDEDAEVARLLAIGAQYDLDTQKYSFWKLALAGSVLGFGLTTAAIVISLAILHMLR